MLIKSQPLNVFFNYKILGVTVDQNLTFDNHVKNVSCKLSKALYCLRRSKNFLPAKSMKMLYFSMFHPHLLYCINIYGCTSKKNIDLLAKKQKQAIRCISNATYNAHTTPLFISNEILPLNQLFKLEKAKFMYKFYNKLLPSSFNNMWSRNSVQQGNRELRNANNLITPAHHYDSLKKLPLFNFPTFWNSLDDFKFLPNFNSFKFILTQHLQQEIQT
jgi:hypothetical protein